MSWIHTFHSLRICRQDLPQLVDCRAQGIQTMRRSSLVRQKRRNPARPPVKQGHRYQQGKGQKAVRDSGSTSAHHDNCGIRSKGPSRHRRLRMNIFNMNVFTNSTVSSYADEEPDDKDLPDILTTPEGKPGAREGRLIYLPSLASTLALLF